MPTLLPHIAFGTALLIATRPNRDYGAIMLLFVLLLSAAIDNYMLPTLLAAQIMMMIILLIRTDC